MIKPCNRIYERIATREIPSRVVFNQLKEDGVMLIMDPFPAAIGHLVTATLACANSADELTFPVLYNKMMTVDKYAGRVLRTVFPDAPYIGGLEASNEIRHPHRHKMPGDVNANWAKRFSKLEDWPRLVPFGTSVEEQAAIHVELGTDELLVRLRDHDDVRDLWEQCRDELRSLGPTDKLTLAAMQQLAIPL